MDTEAKPLAQRTPLVQRVGGAAWPTGLKQSGNDLMRNLMWTADWTWPDTTFEIGNVIHLTEDNTFRLKRIDDPVRVEGAEILMSKPVDPLKPGFWDTALPRPALLRLMPELAIWLSHQQSERADERGQLSEKSPPDGATQMPGANSTLDKIWGQPY